VGNSFKLDDLLGTDTTETKPPRKKGAQQDQGYALDDLLGPDTAAKPAPDTGNVDLSKLPAPAPAPVVAPAPAPAPRRGIGDALAGALGGALVPLSRFDEFMSKDRDPAFREALGVAPLETRTPAVIPDRRTPAEKLAQARETLDKTVQQRPDETHFAPHGSPQAEVEQAAVRDGLKQDEERKARFTPKAWRDIARRGMELANTLHAEGKHDEAEDVNKKAYNAQLLADGAEGADTFGAIALSSLLGIVHDPFEGQRRNMATIRREGSTFVTKPEQKKLGLDEQVATERGFSASKDLAAPLVGSLPLFIGGGVAGRAVLGAAGGALEAASLPRAARIAQALSAEIESAGIYGPRQAGMAGLREATTDLGQNLGKLAARGATEGQVIQAAQAARAAQDVGEDPLAAAASAAIMGGMIGAPRSKRRARSRARRRSAT
jgi:hypothetical protein